MLIKNAHTVLLQMLREFLMNSKVIFESIKGPDNTFHGYV